MSVSYKLMFLATVIGCGAALWMTANTAHVEGQADQPGDAELAAVRFGDEPAGEAATEVVKPLRLQSLSGDETASPASVGPMSGRLASPVFQSQAPTRASASASSSRPTSDDPQAQAAAPTDAPPPVRRFTPDGIIPVDPLIERTTGLRQANPSDRSVDRSLAMAEYPAPDSATSAQETSLWSTPDEVASASISGSQSSLGERRHIIGPGDTFESIALRYLGSRSMWVAISQANPMVDPVRLKPGDVVRIPDQAEIQRFGNQDIRHPDKVVDYVVRPGDTLSTIAKRFYDNPTKWRVIFNANRERIGKDPNRMQAGTRLVIPPAP